MKTKSIFIIGTLCALFAGCSKADLGLDVPETQYTLMLSGDVETKTSLAPEEDGYRPVLWKAGDMIGLFVQKGTTALSGAQNVVARLNDGETNGPGFSRGLFTTTLSLATSTTYNLGIYYPYTAYAGASSEIAHKIPATQTQAACSDSRHLGLSGHFSYATASFTTPESLTDYTPTANFTMSHKTSTILLSLKAASADLAGWKVKSAKVKAPQGYPIAGDMKYVPSTDELTLTGNTSETIALNVPGGAVLSVDTAVELYIVAFPTAIAGKDIEITYTLEAPDASAVKTLTHTRTIKAESNALATGSLHRFSESLPAADEAGWVYSAADAAFDLSANGTANCYVVSAPGTYSFDATVIGNGENGIMLPTSETFFHTEDATIAPTNVKLLWQTAAGLISSVKLDGGKVVFTKPDNAYGNALIAVTDGTNILWSWHIWCTELGALQTYVSKYGSYETMDRNLGATYASTGVVSDYALILRTVGTYYQWGRKDPFMGPASMEVKVAADGTRSRASTALATLYDIEGKTVARVGRTAGSKLVGKSILTTIQKPNMYVQTGGNTASDWFALSGNLTGTGPTARGYSFWGNPEGYNYKSASKPSPVKTIYDPCPPGYMVPPMDWFLGVKQVSGIQYEGGVYTTDGGTTTTWIPYADRMHNNKATDVYVGEEEGNFWYSSYPNSNSSSATSLKLTYTSITLALTKVTGTGTQIRCVQETH